MIRRSLIVLAAAFVTAGTALADTIRVGVASNFLGPATDIASAFETATGHTVLLSAGSTGKLYGQIVAGAPYDVFLAADTARPKALIDKGFAVSGSQRTYAIGTLVLWSARGDVPVTLSRLRAGSYRHLAIAQPTLAPYGRAAIETLSALALTDRTADRLVFGESISQAMSFVATGNAELGFVAKAQVVALSGQAPGHYWQVPAELHRPIEQAGVIVRSDKPAAAEFFEYLRSPVAHDILTRYGYRSP
ncbi:MAG: molybdate ABC transporter substrate-binding protein [Pseudomonadota bacterium]